VGRNLSLRAIFFLIALRGADAAIFEKCRRRRRRVDLENNGERRFSSEGAKRNAAPDRSGAAPIVR
jgi:hypothetical protein